MSTQAYARKNDPQTSWDAARSVKNVTLTQQGIWILLRRRSMTDEQLIDEYGELWADNIGYPESSPSGLRSRRAELVRMGKVEACGVGKTASGRNCTLWRAIPEKGQMSLL